MHDQGEIASDDARRDIRSAGAAEPLGGERVRRRIVDAAARVYAARGYNGTTIPQVAAEAGLSDIEVARHFGARHVLVAVVAADVMAQPPRFPDPPRDASAELCAWCAATYAWVFERRDVLRRLLAETEDHPALATLAVDPLREAIAEVAQYLGRWEAGLRLPSDRWARAGTLARKVYVAALGAAASGEAREGAWKEDAEEALRSPAAR